MRHFPAFHNLNDKPCLLVGGGDAAIRKLNLLTRAGARVHIVSPHPMQDLLDLAVETEATVAVRAFQEFDIDGRVLVIGADEGAVEDVARAAISRSVSVNIVDRPEFSTFITPALIDRDPILVAISSGGPSPTIARKVRQSVEALLPQTIGGFAGLLEKFRPAVHARLAPSERRHFWQKVNDGPVAEKFLAGDESGARTDLLRLVNEPDHAKPPVGHVHLVGAGPGDPDLLTVRALQLLQRADTIVHDRLVAPAILDRARRDAEFVDVGKAPGAHPTSQEEICEILAAHAKLGKTVVRLKGGDPFIFGRGGEEVRYLQDRDIPVSVTPGITAAAGCAASTLIPLTDRDVTRSVTFVTGQGQQDSDDIDWSGIGSRDGTLAIYMGVANADPLSQQLITAGRSPDTPVAIIENGTRPQERVVRCSLNTLAETVRREKVRAPSLILVGDVTRINEKTTLLHDEAPLPAAEAIWTTQHRRMI